MQIARHSCVLFILHFSSVLLVICFILWHKSSKSFRIAVVSISSKKKMAKVGFGSALENNEVANTEEDTNSSFVLERPSATQKTPISYLQEICTRRGLKPDYELLSTEGQVSAEQVHEPTFMFRVTVNDMSAVGQGKSKKTAKHMAAKGLLERMIAVGKHKDFGLGDTPADAAETLNKLADIIGPTRTGGDESSISGNVAPSTGSTTGSDDGDGAGNPVGRLQEMCQQKKWPSPTYELLKEDGMPHEREFIIQITLGRFSADGTSRSKKTAKREAAEKMLKFLEKMPEEMQRENIGTMEEDELAETGGGQAIVQQPFAELDEHFSNLSLQSENVVVLSSREEKRGLKKLSALDLTKEVPDERHKFMSAMTSLGHKVKPITDEERQRVDTFHATLKTEHNDCFEALRALSLSMAPNYAQLLQRIGQTCNFEVVFLPNEARSWEGEYQCLVQLNAMPVAVCYGKGATQDCARQAAAFNALEYLKLMTKA